MENARYKNSSIVVVQMNENEFCLYERESSLLLDDVFSNLKDAVEQARFINNGGGFNGFTPLFMLENTGNVYNVNEEYETEEETIIVGEEPNGNGITKQIVQETDNSKQEKVQS